MIQPSQISYSSKASQIPKAMVPIIPTAMRTLPARETWNMRATSLGTLSRLPATTTTEKTTRAAIHANAERRATRAASRTAPRGGGQPEAPTSVIWKTLRSVSWIRQTAITRPQDADHARLELQSRPAFDLDGGTPGDDDEELVGLDVLDHAWE